MSLQAHSPAELPPAEQPDLAEQGWRRMHPEGLTGYDALLPVLLVRPGDPGRAEARVETGSHSLNVLGGFHGGYLASIGELVLFLPLFLHGKVSSQGAITVDFTIQFMAGGGAGSPLLVSIELLHETGRMAFLRGVMEQDGRRVAAFTGTMRKLGAAR
ncbi:PaaI family thioesterase [Tardibacter chloracetimidivorans]|uniref:PaaI family thioesterase n=1 Tax=Tardibacter chloracetimidivorans TaxID=1921510 RepID=UPI0013012599|nr:PaaI family thioesterase [Tardibacter chloracetimidivorans]